MTVTAPAKVDRRDLVSAFSAIGFKQAGEWPDARLRLKVKELPSLVRDPGEHKRAYDGIDEGSCVKDVIDRVVTAVEAGEEVEWDGEEPEAPKKKKGRGPGNTLMAKPEKAKEADKVTKATTAKAPKGKPAEASPGAEGSTAVKKSTKTSDKGEGGPSNKERVWRLWSKAKDKGTDKAQDYLDKVGGEVKLGTVKGWISAWNRGQNLPAAAKQKSE